MLQFFKTFGGSRLRKLVLVFSLHVLVIVANASMITSDCTPFPFTDNGDNMSGGGTVECPAFNVAGVASLNTVTLTETAEFTGPALFVPVSFVPIGPPGVGWLADPTLFLTSAGETQTASQDATSGVMIANFGSAFDVLVIVGNPGGTAVSTTETVQVSYGYTPSAVPEPVTAPLVGIGVIAIGLAERRKAVRKYQNTIQNPYQPRPPQTPSGSLETLYPK